MSRWFACVSVSCPTTSASARCLIAPAKAGPRSSGFRTSSSCGWMPRDRAAVSISFQAGGRAGLLMFRRAAIRAALGTSSRSSSTRFA